MGFNRVAALHVGGSRFAYKWLCLIRPLRHGPAIGFGGQSDQTDVSAFRRDAVVKCPNLATLPLSYTWHLRETPWSQRESSSKEEEEEENQEHEKEGRKKMNNKPTGCLQQGCPTNLDGFSGHWFGL